MADYGAIRDGLKTRLETISALKVAYDTIPDSVIIPSAVVSPGNPVVEYLGSMAGTGGGLQEFRFEIVALAGRFEPGAGQDTLDSLVSGADSVEAAIRGDATLGGTAVDAVVVRCLDYGSVTVDGAAYYGCRFIVEVKAR
jgi:hypothetical protein